MAPPASATRTDAIHFTPAELYDKEREDLIQFAHAQYKALFQIIRFSLSNGFATKVSVFGRSTRATVCATARIRASIPEMVDVFLGERTNAAIGFAQSQLLYTLMTPTEDHPFRSCGMRWSLWHSPSALIRQRDIVYLEYMDTFVDERGRRGWARMTQSIEHRSCPSIMDSHGIVRAHLYCCGTLYTETEEPGVLKTTTFYDCDTQGVPVWMTKIVANRKAKNPHNLEHLIRLNRIQNDGVELDAKILQLRGKICCGCNAELPRWGKTRKCRDCKEHLCKQCSDVVYCAIEGRKKLNRICVHCVDDFLAREDRQLDIYTASRTSLGSDYTAGTPDSRRYARQHTNSSDLRSGRRESGLSNSNSNSSTAGSESPTAGGSSAKTVAIEDLVRQRVAVRQQARKASAAAAPGKLDLSYLTSL